MARAARLASQYASTWSDSNARTSFASLSTLLNPLRDPTISHPASPRWHTVSAHDDAREAYPRHGLTIMQREVDLSVPERVAMRKERLTMEETGLRFPRLPDKVKFP